jgi:two-component system, cell cycle sensor histidine kinase and response regulator CckA
MTISWLFLNNQIKEELRTQRAQYAHLVENIPEVVWRANKEGDALFISERITDVFGYAPEDVLHQGAKLWFGRMHPEDRDSVTSAYAELFRTGKKFDIQYRIQHRDGHWMWWHDRAELVSDSALATSYADGILSDITRVKELQAQLQQAQKMEAIGQLAGGIAHDFNNLLQIIGGHAELLEEFADLRSREHTAKIRSAADRARSLTEQLLGFSRKQLQHMIVLNLNETVCSLETVLRRTVGEKVELLLQLSPVPIRMKGDSAQMEQILTQIALNARDAMPEGGKLLIETALITVEETGRSPHLPRGEYALLSATDNGCGMDSTTLSRIFEPFFSTKTVGRGRGLGLATVYGIVKQSGGEIIAISEPGHGTCFRIYLPSIADVQESETGTRCEFRANVEGPETILVTEDEAGVRELARAILERLGYRVYSAANANAALDFAAGFAGTIHLLLTDIVMPGCSGSELAQQLGSRFPTIKVLYMTGYADDKLLHSHLAGSHASILRKPFTRDQLAGAVQKAMTGPSFEQITGTLCSPSRRIW